MPVIMVLLNHLFSIIIIIIIIIYRVFRKYIAKIRVCIPEMILNTNHQMSIVPNLSSLGVTPRDRSAMNKLESYDCE